MKSFFKLVKFSFFLVEVLDEPSSPLLHLMKSSLESFNDTCHWPLDLSPILRVPDVVSNEFLNCLLPLFLEEVLVTHHLKLVHQAINVLYQDVVSSDQHFLLLANTQRFVRWRLVRPTSRGVLSRSRCCLGVWDTCLWPFTVSLDPGLGLRSWVLNCGSNASLNSILTEVLFPLFVRSRLNLSRSSFVQVLRGGISCSVLVELFVLLIGCWRQFHLIAYLLFWSITIVLRENSELAIVLDYLIAIQHFLNDLIVRPWVLEEWVIHLASSCGVDS